MEQQFYGKFTHLGDRLRPLDSLDVNLELE
jgi:hypothetical protein